MPFPDQEFFTERKSAAEFSSALFAVTF